MGIIGFFNTIYMVSYRIVARDSWDGYTQLFPTQEDETFVLMFSMFNDETYVDLLSLCYVMLNNVIYVDLLYCLRCSMFNDANLR